MGGRPTPGGAVADFVVYDMLPALIIRVQSYWHTTSSQKYFDDSQTTVRAAMKATQFEEPAVAAATVEPLVTVRKLSPPVSGTRAEMLSGSEADVAARIAAILAEKGLLK